MPWISINDVLPPEGELVRLWDSRHNRLHCGVYHDGLWLDEGTDTAINGVSHWGWILASELADDADD